VLLLRLGVEQGIFVGCPLSHEFHEAEIAELEAMAPAAIR